MWMISLDYVLVSLIHPCGIHLLSKLAMGRRGSPVIVSLLFWVNISPRLQKTAEGENTAVSVMYTDVFSGFWVVFK